MMIKYRFSGVVFVKNALIIFGLSEILIDLDFKISKNQYSQVFIEECKYVIKENKMSEFINDKFEISSDKEVSDEELIKTQDKDSVFLVDCC